MRIQALRVLVLLVLGACGSGGDPAGFTLAFEPIETTPTNVGRVGWRFQPFGDRLVSLGDKVRFLDATGLVEGPSLTAGTVLDGVIVALDAQGKVVKSTDGATFEPVSNEVFADIAAVGSTLIATELVDSFTARVKRSTDGGVTWVPGGVSVDGLLIEQGTLTAQFLGFSSARAWVSFAADADIGPNFQLAQQVWEVRPDASTRLVAENAAALVPYAAIADEWFVVQRPSPENLAPFNRSLVHFKRDFVVGDAIEAFTPVHVALPGMEFGLPDHALMGFDAQGRVIVNFGGVITRSKTPLSAGDQSATLLPGPGCKDWVNRADNGGDSVTVAFTNSTGESVRIRAIDHQNRARTVATVEAGGTTKVRAFGVLENTLLMASALSDDVCLGTLLIPDDVDDDLPWTLEFKRE